MTRHRGGPVASRLRYRRVTAAGSAVLVTLVALLGAAGILPTGSSPEPAYAGTPSHAAGSLVAQSLPHPDHRPVPAVADPTQLPADSGSGKRVVFDIGAQRVWLVSARDQVRRTYLVSGSLTDNLDAGAYDVWSRSRWAVGVDDSGVMQYMVRFAHGARAAIGFHDIPTRNGEALQTRAQLGTPQSHGCIRQRRVDARALWSFAPVGTPVVVLA